MTDCHQALWRTAFLRLWAGTTASGFAMWGVTFLLGLAVSEGRLSAGLLGLALAFRSVGFLIGVAMGGNLADRSGARQVIFWSGLVAAVGAGVLVAGLLGFGGQIALLLGSTATGFGQGACRPAYQAAVPRIVPEPLRQRANAAMSLSLSIALFAGPLMATALAAATGVPAALSLTTLLWLVSAFVPPGIAHKAAMETSNFIAEIRSGLREAARHSWFFPTLAALSATIAFGYSATNVLLPVVSGRLGGGDLLAIAMTAYTLGGLIGAFVIGQLKVARRETWFCAGLAAYGLAPLSLIGAESYILPALGYFIGGVGIQIFNILWFTHIQSEVAPDKLARVSSLDFLCSFGLAPLGLAFINPLAEGLGIGLVLALSAGVSLLAPLAAWLWMRR